MSAYRRMAAAMAVWASVALLSSPAAEAHHSKAMFDNDKCTSIEGTMVSFEWVYPHAWLWIVVHNANGVDDTWGFESMSPSQLYGVDHRWTRDTIKKGDKLKVRYSPLKDGRHGGSMNSVTLPSGEVYLGSPDACMGAKDNPKSLGDPDSPLRQ